MGTDRRRLEMVVIKVVSNYPSDHLVLQADIIFSPTEVGRQYKVGGITAQSGSLYVGSKETGRW